MGVAIVHEYTVNVNRFNIILNNTTTINGINRQIKNETSR